MAKDERRDELKTLRLGIQRGPQAVPVKKLKTDERSNALKQTLPLPMSPALAARIAQVKQEVADARTRRQQRAAKWAELEAPRKAKQREREQRELEQREQQATVEANLEGEEGGEPGVLKARS